MVRALSPLQAHALLAFKDASLNMSKSTIECAMIVTRSKLLYSATQRLFFLTATLSIQSLKDGFEGRMELGSKSQSI